VCTKLSCNLFGAMTMKFCFKNLVVYCIATILSIISPSFHPLFRLNISFITIIPPSSPSFQYSATIIIIIIILTFTSITVYSVSITISFINPLFASIAIISLFRLNHHHHFATSVIIILPSPSSSFHQSISASILLFHSNHLFTFISLFAAM
jgi:hypothetical protein